MEKTSSNNNQKQRPDSPFKDDLPQRGEQQTQKDLEHENTTSEEEAALEQQRKEALTERD